MNINMLKKYADLAIKIGVNLQKDQLLVINSPIECAEFTRFVSESAYKNGAKDVIINWSDEKSAKIRYMNSDISVFKEMYPWEIDTRVKTAKMGAAFLSISASDPTLMKEVDPNVISTAQKTRNKALKEFSDRIMSNKNSWSIVSIPTVGWATKVFPNDREEKAIEKLWDEIFKIVRLTEDDPVEAWNAHKANLKVKMDFLNEKNFKSIHYTNSKGTDLTIQLPKEHIWCGGGDFTPDNVEFIANMPTEEIFTLPKRDGINGIVYSTKPLSYGGNLIENFSLTFKDGRIIDFKAEKGEETLKHLIDTDEGSHYLGEVALVPFDSPISNSGIIFFNTLYDENASCHLAIGEAYPSCLHGGETLSDEELLAKGANRSLTHVDFMIGSKDLSITGIAATGDEIQIFKNGNWAF